MVTYRRPVLIFGLLLCHAGRAASFDAAPFGLPLPEGNGIMWEDPREIHQVVVHFLTAPAKPEDIRLEYWGSRWPKQHLPKDREPGGADVGWMELGNWYQGGWRIADAEAKVEGPNITFDFRPVNEKEFPNLKDYPARFRYTLKLRVTSKTETPVVESFETFTDSEMKELGSARLAWKSKPLARAELRAFNGGIGKVEQDSPLSTRFTVVGTVNPDPNTFDRTIVTVRNYKTVFSFAMADLKSGPLFLPEFDVAVLGKNDLREYASLAAEQRSGGAKTLYDRVAEMPEQTWSAAWAGIPRKKSDIYFPLGLDGGRQRFRLQPDGAIEFRSNDQYLRHRPGQDTPRLALEPAQVQFHFGPAMKPVLRTLQEESLPICQTTWEKSGVRISQTAFVTELGGTKASGPTPPADTLAVFMAQFVFTNVSTAPQEAELRLEYKRSDGKKELRIGGDGVMSLNDSGRGQVVPVDQLHNGPDGSVWKAHIAPGEAKTAVVKIPYLALTNASEIEALKRLDFQKEREAIAGYWHRRLEESARLITPEPMLNEFYRAVAGHMLINCEREPNSTRRFARVGSFHYGAYGNESCMMVVDLDRRGYHREAQECLDAWLHYQGTVPLPGDFESQEGVLYGAGGYEAGGYNQHHGWILWCLAEHYRYTRDDTWLRTAAPGILAGADWIIRESKRTANRHELERGLLPAGSLEDIGDWWPWLSTSCYTWRGLDSAAWALEQLKHPEANRVRREADAFRTNMLENFRKASERSPVVRLRDGTAVPQIPSQVHRRGRSFGWICQTLEGAMHLLITRAIEPHSPEADRIVRDYEDNLYLSNQYGYTLEDFEKYWFARGGMSMQACLLFDVEPYLYRDDIKHALRALFNAESVSYFPDVRMNTEHAAPYFDDWRGDHYKSSDEANCCGWLRQLFVREEGDELLLGQAVPREWLKPGKTCGLERGATHFGPVSIVYTGGDTEFHAEIAGPQRNPPKAIKLRFRTPNNAAISSVSVNGEPWKKFDKESVYLSGDVGKASIVARFDR